MREPVHPHNLICNRICKAMEHGTASTKDHMRGKLQRYRQVKSVPSMYKELHQRLLCRQRRIPAPWMFVTLARYVPDRIEAAVCIRKCKHNVTVPILLRQGKRSHRLCSIFELLAEYVIARAN